MKVKLEESYRDFYTLTDLERAKAVIKAVAEDTETAKGWARYAVAEALKKDTDSCRDIITASAHTAKNCRAWNAYGTEQNSQDMDVWVEALAKTWHGYIEVGAYLTDIWQSGGTPYAEHMYIRRFKEVQ